MSLFDIRHATAEKIYLDFDFIYQVGDADGWKYNEADNSLTRSVYLEKDLSDEPTEDDTLKASFTIRFGEGSTIPVDATCNLNGDNIGEYSGPIENYAIKKMYEPKNDQIWFHGTPSEFDKFDGKYIGQGLDELGSGFYFSNDEETAHNYALFRQNTDEGFVLVAKLDIKKPLHADCQISKTEIRNILKGAPQLTDVLWNFGDLKSQSEADILRVLDGAAQTYANMNGCDDVLSILNSMNNDFFGGDEALFLAKVTEATGYDGLYREKGGQVHAVAWNPDQIEIMEVRQVYKDAYRP